MPYALPPVDSIAAAIATAPAWALVSLTIADEQLRNDGAHELARWIAERAERAAVDHRQMALPL